MYAGVRKTMSDEEGQPCCGRFAARHLDDGTGIGRNEREGHAGSFAGGGVDVPHFRVCSPAHERAERSRCQEGPKRQRVAGRADGGGSCADWSVRLRRWMVKSSTCQAWCRKSPPIQVGAKLLRPDFGESGGRRAVREVAIRVKRAAAGVQRHEVALGVQRAIRALGNAALKVTAAEVSVKPDRESDRDEDPPGGRARGGPRREMGGQF